MTRSLAILLVGLALIALLVVLTFVSVPRVRSAEPHAYRPLPEALFSPWPDVPVDAGRPLESQAPLTQGLRTDGPSILPSAQPTGGLIPPFVAEKGVAGQATWWASFGHGMYAAAGPRLRDVLGPNYVGQWVSACSGGRCVRVKLITSCACPGDRLIDLSLDAFQRLAAPSVGILEVTVSW